MKKIAVLGNIGKTTTIELLFQYLTLKGYRTMLYCTNGVFDNTSLVNKDSFNYVSDDMYRDFIEDKEEYYDYCLVEMTEESAYLDLLINQSFFQLVINASFDPIIYDFHQDEYSDFGFKFLRELDTNQLIIKDSDADTYQLSRPYSTYSSFEIVSTSFNGTNFIYNNKTYFTNLINNNILIDLAGVTKAIELLNEFDEDIYTDFLQQAFVRGRYEKHYVNNKNIIINTGWNGIDHDISDLLQENIFTPLDDTDIIFIPHPHLVTPTAKAVANRAKKGKFLKDNNIHLIITDSRDKENTLTYFEQEYAVPANYTDYVYIADKQQALDTALHSEKHNILILGSYYTRYFRYLVEQEEEKEMVN